MTRYVALDRASHRYAGLLPVASRHARDRSIVPLVAEEVPRVMATMVIAFARKVESNGYQLAALQSLHPGENVYVHTDGRWLGGYRPAWYREYPFRLVADRADPEKKIVCVDESSEFFCLDPVPGLLPFFDEDGELSAMTKKTLTFLEKLEQARLLTELLVRQLDDAGVIVPWSLTVRSEKDEVGFRVPDLFRVNEAVLRALEPGVVSSLLKSGALSLAFSQLMSEHRLGGLCRLQEMRIKSGRDSAATAEEMDLESLFSDDDNLTF